MDTSYVERRDGGYWVAGTRVPLDSVVQPFREGQTAEAIAEDLPALRLEQVYGAIAFYLAYRSEIDSYLSQAQAEYDAARCASRSADPAFYEKLAKKLAQARQPQP
jgi:uncharacterized protein (DUF433 family)